MPRDYADVIAACWHDDPTQRPSFAALLEPVRDMAAAVAAGGGPGMGTRLTTSAASTASTANGSPGAAGSWYRRRMEGRGVGVRAWRDRV